MKSATERLFTRLMIQPDGCVVWQGARNSCGYGHLNVGGRPPRGRMTYAHRLMYELFAGPVPAGMELDHLCRNRACANVSHLEPVTHRENLLRGTSPVAIHAAATHCPSGHPYDERNTHRRPDGGRICRTCTRGRRK